MGKRKHVSRACDFCRESKVKVYGPEIGFHRDAANNQSSVMQLGHLVQTVNTECVLAIIKSELIGESLLILLLAS